MGVPSPEGVQGRAAGAGVAAAELSIPPSAGDTAGEMRGVSGAPLKPTPTSPVPWRPAQAVGPGTLGSWCVCPEDGWVPSSGRPCSGAEAVEIENSRSTRKAYVLVSPGPSQSSPFLFMDLTENP